MASASSLMCLQGGLYDLMNVPVLILFNLLNILLWLIRATFSPHKSNDKFKFAVCERSPAWKLSSIETQGF